MPIKNPDTFKNYRPKLTLHSFGTVFFAVIVGFFLVVFVMQLNIFRAVQLFGLDTSSTSEKLLVSETMNDSAVKTSGKITEQQQVELSNTSTTSDPMSEGIEALEDFRLNYFEMYSSILSPNSAEDITRVHKMEVVETRGQSPINYWFVQVGSYNGDAREIRYFLLNPNYQVELNDLDAYNPLEVTNPCLIDNVFHLSSVSPSKGDRVRTLSDSVGYLLLNGEECLGWGGAAFDFTAVYSLSDGKKIQFKEGFTLDGRRDGAQSITENGSNLLKLVSIRGINNPILEFQQDNGVSYSAPFVDSEVYFTAYYSLETGELLDHISFTD